MKTHQGQSHSMLPVSVIFAASNGDEIAMELVLKIYEPYISKLALRSIYNDDGQMTVRVDDLIKRRLETKLITQVLKFEVSR